jgi:putative MATE family efflux protein
MEERMAKDINLTEGNIIKTLTKLAIPIMGTSFIQMAYNLTDVMWLGRLSTKAVAAAGTAGFFMWLANSLVLITQVGLGVNVAQNIGKGDIKMAKDYTNTGFQTGIIIALIYAAILVIFNKELISFFNLKELDVIHMSESYLRIIGSGIIFHLLNPIFSVSLNSSGNSVTPFRTNAIGLLFNIVIDPVLIFGLGPFPKMGIKGAAIATILSQLIVTIGFVIAGKRNELIYSHVKIFKEFDFTKSVTIIKLGLPPAVQNTVHAFVSMIITRIIAKFGALPIAVMTVGSQIESLSWTTSEGFSAALSAFVGQNFGAMKYNRVKEGYHKGIKVLTGFGLAVSLLFILFPEPIFSIFTPEDPLAIKAGGAYLRILGLSQAFMSLEIGTAGSFNGLGKTLPPTAVGTTLNILRIPAAIILSGTSLGVEGVWWAISMSSVLKGIILYIMITMEFRKDIYYTTLR